MTKFSYSKIFSVEDKETVYEKLFNFDGEVKKFKNTSFIFIKKKNYTKIIGNSIL